MGSQSRVYCLPLCAFVCLSFLLAVSVVAQNNASIQGTVLDPNGAAVANAKVTATNQETGVVSTTKSTAEGFYKISGLPPGRYTIAAEVSGFKAFTGKDIDVQAEQPRGFDIKLEVGAVTETVTVNATNVGLETESGSTSETLTAAQVERLPIFGRDPYELLRLAPGVFGDGARTGSGLSVGFPNGPGANNGSGGPGGSNTAIFQTENQQSISASGQRITSNDYTIDGVSVNSLQWGGAAVLTPSPDSVQEITVLSNTYDASDGRNSGAHVKVVTKSGTNQLHGGAFFQYETPGLNAFNKYNGFQPGSGLNPFVRNDDAFRQYGADVGGPIVKNKLFFFFNFEGLRDNLTNFEDQWVETSQYRSLVAADRPGTPVAATLMAPGVAPRIAQVLTQSCAVFGTNPCKVVNGGVDIGSPTGAFGQYVYSFGCTNTAANPNPSCPGTVNPACPTGSTSCVLPNHVGGGLDGIPDLQFVELFLPDTTRARQYNARVDYVMGHNTFSVNTFLTWLNFTNADPAAQGRPMSDITDNRFTPSGFLSWVDTISTTMVNEARFNFTRWGFDEISSNPNVNWAIPRTEIQGLPLPGGQRIIFGAPQADTTPAIYAENTFAARDMLSKVIGPHGMKFGFEFARLQNNDNDGGGVRPDYVFNEPWNFANGTPIFEQIEVNPLTGGPASLARYYRDSDYAAFFQDDWKVRSNLTLNLGLRWEYFSPPTEAKGNLENIIPGASPITGLAMAKAVMPSQMWNGTWRNFGPRIGFAYSPDMLHGKGVIRGGFGIVYDRFDNVTFDNTRDNPPLVASYGICCGTGAGEFGSPFVNGQILYALGSNPAVPGSYPINPALATPLNPATNLPTILTGFSPPNVWSNPVNMPIPYIYEFSLQTQYELPKSWLATIGYQGSNSHRLTRIKNLTEFYPTQNPDIGQVFTPTPDTNAQYNALITQLEHRFHGGFQLNMIYTWSKSMDQISAEGPGFVTNQTFPINDQTEHGPSDFDATYQFKVYGLWDLPIFRNRHDWIGRIAGGWEINGVFQFHSGFPWTPVADNVCPVIGSINNCPIRPIGQVGQVGHDPQTSAFLPPVAANVSVNQFILQTTCGNPCLPLPPGVPRNGLRGPRYSDFDFSFVKGFGIPTNKVLGENGRIELRMNLYNAFNKLNLAPFTFGSSSTTVSFSGNPAVANPLFGIASAGLAGRTVELQGRFVF